MLWGRAAGICCNPTCRIELTQILESDNYNVGEMAHVIARKEGGPRGIKGGGKNDYDNLILLCPTCHKHIDKSPEGTYTCEELYRWKDETELMIRSFIRNVARNDPYKVFEVANNSLSYLSNILYFTNIRLSFCKNTDARLYQMVTRVMFHLDFLNVSDDKREAIVKISKKIQERSNNGFYYFRDFERLARELADNCYAAFIDPYDKSVFNFARSYVDLLRSIVLDEFNSTYRYDFEQSYFKLFDNKDCEIEKILDEMQETDGLGQDSSLEAKLFRRVKYLLYNEHRG